MKNRQCFLLHLGKKTQSAQLLEPWPSFSSLNKSNSLFFMVSRHAVPCLERSSLHCQLANCSSPPDVSVSVSSSELSSLTYHSPSYICTPVHVFKVSSLTCLWAPSLFAHCSFPGPDTVLGTWQHLINIDKMHARALPLMGHVPAEDIRLRK